MSELVFNDGDVAGLLSGSIETVKRIDRLARATAGGLFARRDGSTDVPVADLVQTALFDAFTAVQDGSVRNAEALVQTVQRSVWREVKHAQRLGASPRISAEEFDRLAGSYPSPELFALANELEASEPSESDGVQLLFEQAKSPHQEAKARIDLVAVDDELIAYLKAHPDEMYSLQPRRFEELVAAILSNLGYTIELTGRGADGGIDIIATQKSGVGESLIVVDCKRYGPKKPVGVGIVRSLYGIAEQMRASHAMLATTSFFTAPAREFQRAVRYRMSLKEHKDLISWLNGYGHFVR